MENLCFILEAIQYKKQFIPNYEALFKDNVRYQDDSVGWIIKLPNGLPSSSIIENEDNYGNQIVQLYEKYISHEADLCVNISYDARKQFVSDMEMVTSYQMENEWTGTVKQSAEEKEDTEMEIKRKMIKIFDGALSDIDTNLASSFVRSQLYGSIDTKQDIINVMIEQTK